MFYFYLLDANEGSILQYVEHLTLVLVRGEIKFDFTFNACGNKG